MPTRISAGVGSTIISLLFITMIPINCKITNFPYTCYFIRKYMLRYIEQKKILLLYVREVSVLDVIS